LVIGGGGFVGSHLVPRLIASGRRTTVVGRSTSCRHILPDAVTYVSGDFGELDVLRRLLDSHEEIIHLAYTTVPNTSFANPLEDLHQNLSPTVQLFTEAAERERRLVLISSGGTVYGEAVTLPIAEDHPTQPISPYGVTKLTLEKYANLYMVTHGLKVIVVRPANAYGEGQLPFVGQGFVATAMASAMKGQSIKIFGECGTVRDYTYVSDLADGIVNALDRGVVGEIYNIGSGVGRTNLEVVAAISQLIQKDVHIEHLQTRVFDVKANVLDSTKLRQHTDWIPHVNFEEGLLRTHEWLRGQSV
jgi:UDP-glucose 4-epimerase